MFSTKSTVFSLSRSRTAALPEMRSSCSPRRRRERKLCRNTKTSLAPATSSSSDQPRPRFSRWSPASSLSWQCLTMFDNLRSSTDPLRPGLVSQEEEEEGEGQVHL